MRREIGSPGPAEQKNGQFPDGTAHLVVGTAIARTLFFLEFLVFVLELVDTSGGIYQFGLTGVIRVGSPGNLEFYQRIRYPIYNNRFLGLSRRLGDKNIVIGHVFERD